MPAVEPALPFYATPARRGVAHPRPQPLRARGCTDTHRRHRTVAERLHRNPTLYRRFDFLASAYHGTN